MDELKFRSLAELYKRLLPALRSKKKALLKDGYKYVDEKDIWNCLKVNKWSSNNPLTLDKMVDDILNTNNDLFADYISNRKIINIEEKRNDLL